MDFCLRRALALRRGEGPPLLLEPSAGDGNFLRGVLRHADEQGLSGVSVVAVERDAEAARACAEVAARLGARLVHDSFFAWAEAEATPVDLLVGNPPFVRYQLVPPEDRARAERLLADLAGVSNLWLPFALLGLERLRPGGAFSLVLPAELLATVSAGRFREALLQGFEDLTLTLFPRDTFPELLQDVLVVSGRKAASSPLAPPDTARLTFEEQGRRWAHPAPLGPAPWIRWLLTEAQLEAFGAAAALPGAHPLGELARLQVSTVTGANAFFTVDEATRRQRELEPWCRPLLPRTAYAEGLIVREADHDALIEAGRRAWLVDMRGPEPHAAARAWIAEGEAEGLHRRYKCRVRSPWYQVPVVEPGALLLTKRAHQHHRLLRNAAGLLSTDTIYQGRMRPPWEGQADALVASFHSSLSLLSVEVEGRSYGGGVIELVPSEIAQVQVLLAPLAEALPELDALSRAHGGQRDEADQLVHATDALLAAAVPGYAELAPILREARCALRSRRFAR
ncbi:MAG: SAM-dependent methyltransferase [Alphaproteobacteria bacterium]|nr:SAM-dependent methyltransferase [Alphaproteobacteria bacterium]MCB9793401.1 SAM-dependent methyltransferase [Alphaproteobacteria bacterium]